MSNIVAKAVRIFGLITAVVAVGLVALRRDAFSINANAPWGDAQQVFVGLAVQSGNSVSAWTDRGDETANSVAWMTAVGDGTYQYQLNLVPNAVYNYLFFAKSVSTATALYTPSFASGTINAEPVPSSGRDAGTFISTNSNGSMPLDQSVSVNGTLTYGTANGDGRRLLTMPDDLWGSATVYVYNNFASTPTGVGDYTVVGSSAGQAGGIVKLNFAGCLGYWGTGFKSMDCLGGGFQVYRGTDNNSGAQFTLKASLGGRATFYNDVDVSTSQWYYYILVTSDSYSNTASTQMAFARLNRTVPTTGASWSSSDPSADKRGKPANAVPVIFKVEKMNEQYIKEHGNVVYMTPWGEDGRVYPNKVPGILMKVWVPGSEG